MVASDNFIMAKDYRKLTIDELIDTMYIAANVLRDKYIETLAKIDKPVVLLYYKERIGTLAKTLLDISF